MAPHANPGRRRKAFRCEAATVGQARAAQRRGPISEAAARDVAQRNILIRELFYADLAKIDALSILTGLSRKQLRRVLAVTVGASPPPKLSPLECRELRREYASDPDTVAWIEAERRGVRRNGHRMTATEG